MPLVKPKGTQRPRKPIIAADIETVGLGGDFIIGAYTVEDSETVYYFHSPEEWLDIILSRRYDGYTWYAHNGGEYDYKYLLDPIRKATKRGWTSQPIMQGERVIGFKFANGHHQREIRDSYALIPTSLEKLTAAFAPTLHKRDIGLAKGVVFNPNNVKHMEYLNVDVLGLKQALITIETILLEEFGTKARWTIPATALESWKRMLPPTAVYWRPRADADAIFREAYYGGMVFLTTQARVDDVVGIDVNSMYPAMMEKYGVPSGTPMYVRKEHPGKPGFYRVHAIVPEELVIPPLPKRLRGGGILWPTGEFDTTISSDELSYARDLGCTIEVVDGFVFDGIDFVFEQFISRSKHLRYTYPRGNPLHEIGKLLQNSLYGKFGTRPVIKRYVLTAEQPNGLTPHIDPKTGEPVDNLYWSIEKLDAPYLLPHWAAWITAHARITLHRGLMAVGAHNALYGDTDSIKVRRAAFESAHARGDLPVDPNLYGYWKLEEQYAWFQPVAPKNYLWMKEHDGIQELGGKAKGIKRDVYDPIVHATAVNVKVQVTFIGSNSTRRLIERPPLAIMEERKRAYSRLENSRGWRATGDDVRPVRLDQPASGVVSFIRKGQTTNSGDVA